MSLNIVVRSRGDDLSFVVRTSIPDTSLKLEISSCGH